MPERRPDRTLGPIGAYSHDTFWDWAAKGELRLQKCGSCGEIAWPVVAACETCGSAQLEWARMSGRGSLVSWCTFERDYNRGMLPVPWDTVLVELEEGALFIGNPQGFSWPEMTVGMPVEVAFVAAEDAAGPFSLPVFRKA
ncbi:MAG: OB-fold domain-containing protein [Novosphingobium sp.]